MRIGLLGGVRATTDDGEPIDIGSPRSQAVLAALALWQGTPVPVSRLIDLVWGDSPPASPKAVQWHIAQLRKALGASAITTVGAAYRLDVPTDVSQFRQFVRAGDTAAAVAAWGGVPLAGLSAPGLASAVSGLVEEWLAAVEMDFSRRVMADPRSVVGELSSFVSEHPTREGLAALLMTALYRTGRQADALAVYQRVRQHLVAELGVEPGPALRAVEQEVLAHAEVPGPVLIGRDAELVLVSEALRWSPVVTLVGPGGIGKTRLALALGGTFVSLAEITSSSEVPRAVADALGIVERPGVTVAQAVLSARPSLLVLDNCEHVLDGAAAFASTVCSSVRVLATSRERLSVADEQVVVVEPLDVDASVELFDLRARAADSRYSRDSAVYELCQRLDGIPLAIELAAARVRSHRPAELLTRLDIGVRRTGSSRHRTLRAAIQWSYDLLSVEEQELFCRLSVFAGPFDLDAVSRDSLLGDLVERSVVAVHEGPFGRRFRLLEPLRQFASSLLRDRSGALAAHASWCVRQVAAVGTLLSGPGEAEGVGRLAELWPNLRAAVTWAFESGDLGLADALVRPVVLELPLRGRREIGDWAERLIGGGGGGGGEARPDGFWLIWVAERNTQSSTPAALPRTPDDPLSRYARAYASGDGTALLDSLPNAVSALNDPRLSAFLELMPSGTLLGAGRFEHVDTVVTKLAERYRVHGPPTLLHWALQTLGYSAMFQGRDPDPFFDEAADVDLPPGTLSANKTTEARREFRRGDTDRALELLAAHVDELLETGNVVAASVVAVEFVAVTKDALPEEAAVVLGYLKHANDFGALAAQRLLGDLSAAKPGMDDREALLYMRRVLSAGRGRSGSRRPPDGLA
ncbi:BTAD domain-containing putative transcriptional regulator [Lentzea rhizosphaerae]|uniref:BTAD domain-containing putative transcriptional regulator n=1 Tax=Lentzea rhizosphaerae TaxID=2041025 RepID=A0ABV8BZ29_9PSEU